MIGFGFSVFTLAIRQMLGFEPRSLFTAGEQGVWYDPSDLTTLFQDSAGTTPVTAVEQPVGRMLDKSGRGNHAFQATAGNRPTLSARVNLLTKTEQFDDVVWTKTSVTVTANATTAPDGTLTADKLIPAAGVLGNANNGGMIRQVGNISAGSYTYLIHAKAAEFSTLSVRDNTLTGAVLVINLLTGVITNPAPTRFLSPSATPIGNGWYAVRFNTPTISLLESFSYRVQETGDGTSGIYIWGADLRPADQSNTLIPQYQRVNTSTDYDTAGFPLYLKFNGTSSSMATNSINFTATDKMTVWAGVRKLSDAAFAAIAELSASADVNVGSFNIGTSTLNGDASRRTWASVLTGTTNLLSGAATYASPDVRVLTTQCDISQSVAAQELRMRLNGVDQTLVTSGTSAGTGNFGTYPLHIGARNSSANFFNGNLYSLIVRGAQSSAAQISSAEAWVNQRTKAY